jgi:nucleotide-binding universal stress UspA family protein
MPMSPKRLLVAMDLSPPGEAKLAVVEEHARALNAEVLLLHVLPEKAAPEDGTVSPEEARARAYLDSVVVRLRLQGLRAWSLVRVGPVAPTILAAAREFEPDVLVIGSSVRGGLARLLPGSIADEIVRNAPCPVLLVRPASDPAPVPAVRSFGDDAARAGALAPQPLGNRTVELSRIIGSVGRPAELGANFRPLRPQPQDEQRYQRILRALERGETLPPVELYKLGYGYYVLDGHHRVAAAKQLGQLWIDALVTEFVPVADAESQQLFAERRVFEQATGLTQIGLARPGNYARLEALIREYAAAHGLADLREAAARWYTEIFRPLQVRLRALRLHLCFPGERSADVFVRLAEHRRCESARQGRELSWDEALHSFAAAQRASA